MGKGNDSAREGFAAFACDLADAARRITVPAAGLLSAEDKNPGGAFDPVTAADLKAELAMRALIEEHYPDHGIEGEEMGRKAGAGRFVWSLDPIDGTRAFICGLPSWTTLIALLQVGEPLIGLIDAPMVGERYLGSEDKTRLIGPIGSRIVAASNCRTLHEARLATTDPYLFEGAEAEAFDRLRTSVRLTRYGYDAYAYARLAAGGVDLVVESGLKHHDWHALVPVVRSAGGVIGNWRGGDDLTGGDLVAAASQELFRDAVSLLTAA